jgi:hypothetical protein
MPNRTECRHGRSPSSCSPILQRRPCLPSSSPYHMTWYQLTLPPVNLGFWTISFRPLLLKVPRGAKGSRPPQNHVHIPVATAIQRQSTSSPAATAHCPARGLQYSILPVSWFQRLDNSFGREHLRRSQHKESGRDQSHGPVCLAALFQTLRCTELGTASRHSSLG